MYFGLQLSRFRSVLMYDMHERKFHQTCSGLNIKNGKINLAKFFHQEDISYWNPKIKSAMHVMQFTWALKKIGKIKRLI